MNNRFTFTRSKLAELVPLPSGKRAYYYDTKVPGFCVLVTGTGHKSFYLYKKIQRHAERLFIGKVADVKLEVARGRATEMNGLIAQGINPQETRKAKLGEPTLKDLFAEYRDRHLRPYRRPKTSVEADRQFSVYLKRWHNRQLSSIQRREVQSLHSQIGKENGQYQANRVLTLLNAMFNKAKAWGLFAGDNPAEGVERFPERSRERFLQRDEVQRLGAALDEEPNTIARDCLRLCLLTGARRSNVQAMAWKDLDFERAEWRIPDTKSGEPQTVTLTVRALTILQHRLDDQEHPTWVFPGSGKSGHIVELKSVWSRLLKRAEIEDLRIHDLRRTAGSWQAITGASLPIIGKSLGHRTSSATQVYSRLTQDPVRESMEKAQDAMFEKDEQIVPLKQGVRAKK